MLLERVEGYILKNGLILPGNTVVIGFSGGPDSLCLSDILRRLSDKHGWRIILAHFDHQLRGEASREDARFCREWAQSKGLDFRTVARNIAAEARATGESTELAARRCRYAFFAQIQSETGAQRIALGHHQDDQAETVLMRLIRGTGVDGLAGMRPLRRDGVIRPLLAEPRSEIMEYCSQEVLTPRIDHTNMENRYTRNGLRLEVLPLLAERYNPRIAEALCRTAAQAAEDSDCLNQMADAFIAEQGRATSGYLELPAESLSEQPAAIQKRVLRNAVRRVMGSAENLESEHLEQIRKLLSPSQTGKQTLFCGARIQRNYEVLTIREDKAAPVFEEVKIRPAPSVVKAFGGRFVLRAVTRKQWETSMNRGPGIIVIDADAIQGSLCVRQRRPGDVMIPLGMKGFKKIKNVMIDLKIPRDIRDTVPVLCDAEKIIWIAGVRMDERVRVKPETKKLMEICWEVCCSPGSNMLE